MLVRAVTAPGRAAGALNISYDEPIDLVSVAALLAGFGACGYILGTGDTRAFEARCEAKWWPALRARYADTIRTLHDVAEGLVPFAADNLALAQDQSAVIAAGSPGVVSAGGPLFSPPLPALIVSVGRLTFVMRRKPSPFIGPPSPTVKARSCRSPEPNRQ